MKLAVILFNLGGPDSPEAVEPFLRNLFSDPAIIALPALLRLPLARYIARRRAPVARAIYDHIGGKSPIFAETRKQADALEAALSGGGGEAGSLEVKAFVAMRCWHPFSDGAARALPRQFDAGPHRGLCRSIRNIPPPPAPPRSRIGTRAAKKAGLTATDLTKICCYP